MNTKICKKCDTEKEKIHFYEHKAVCKVCILNKNKKQCKYCSKFFVNLESHEKTKHQEEEEFKYLKSISLFTCKECKKIFLLNNFNHYADKCKKCYKDSRKKEKIKCNNCEKMFNYYWFKNHKCKDK